VAVGFVPSCVVDDDVDSDGGVVGELGCRGGNDESELEREPVGEGVDGALEGAAATALGTDTLTQDLTSGGVPIGMPVEFGSVFPFGVDIGNDDRLALLDWRSVDGVEVGVPEMLSDELEDDGEMMPVCKSGLDRDVISLLEEGEFLGLSGRGDMTEIEIPEEESLLLLLLLLLLSDAAEVTAGVDGLAGVEAFFFVLGGSDSINSDLSIGGSGSCGGNRYGKWSLDHNLSMSHSFHFL
jgi:hypothetical protein